MKKIEFTKKHINKKTGEATDLPKKSEQNSPKSFVDIPKKEEKKKIGFPFLPLPVGTSPYHKRRVENGGKIVRLKRK